MENTWSNEDWEMVVKECTRGARRMAARLELRKCEIQDLESQLVEDIFKDITRKDPGEILNLLAFVRYSIKQRSTDYLRNNRSRINYETFSFTDRTNKDYIHFTGEEYSILDDDMFKAGKGRTDHQQQYEIRAQIEELRSHLSESDNRIFELMFVREMKSKEICSLVGCSINTPRNVQKRVIELAKKLEINFPCVK